MPTRRSSRRAAVALATGLATVLFISAAEARNKDRVSEYAPSYAPAPVTAPVANGSIFQVSQGYAPLTSGTRAAMVGDVLTIALVERTLASKSATQTADRAGNIGLTPPTTGPLSFFSPSDVNMGGNSTFNGKGQATQSNALQGEISVTVAEVYPNGTMLVRGEKLVRLNRGDEFVQFSGLVRPTDIGADNRVLSTRVADARINYTGKGEVARASRQGWMQRFFSMLSPF
ncbi:flagellar basal body L-ring protein FlgH [Sphingomonas cavernae]|uniref:Flagellar L-ring protein n=1 Tax=Sphingomonas cavernae TaxID=2320861 RepID=A0A418WPR3_9SPHN|nr:flagellar basal body L-ring protein FlgH [Sphingomonas cavernae]RJF93242.1 flagellar basal body L-ring protein FlgH [Sphingomonas cavernae]